MGAYRTSAHAVFDIESHIVCITKYRYKILRGRVAERARDLLRQIRRSREVVIVRGADFLLQSTRAFLREDATLGLEIDLTRVRVLPPMYTPQNGLTDRSLSLYLAMCDAGEVMPRWLSTQFLQGDSINLPLIPWPLEVLVRQVP